MSCRECEELRKVNAQLKRDYDRVERERSDEARDKFRMGQALQESEARVSRLEDEVEALQDELASTHRMFSDE